MTTETVAHAADARPSSPADAAAAGSVPPARRVRDSAPRTLADWRPEDAVTLMTQDVELASPLLRRNINRMGMRAQISLYLLQRVIPESGMIQEAAAFEAAFNERMSALDASIEEAQEELSAICKRVGLDRNPPKQSTKPLTMKIPIYSPGMLRFVQTLLKVDSYFCRLDYLWMNSQVSTATQWEKINHFRRAVWAEVQFLSLSWQHARGSLKQVQEGRRQALRGNRTEAELGTADA